MWTEAHWARHEVGLKELVSPCAVEELARWPERADPPQSDKAMPVLPVVRGHPEISESSSMRLSRSQIPVA